MYHLIVLIGLICLVPKLSLSLDWAFVTPVGSENVTYWQEKCRFTAGESSVRIAKDAKTRALECAGRMELENQDDDFEETAAERICRTEFRKEQCEKGFFEDVSPCINEEEAKRIHDFYSTVRAALHRFGCDGGKTSLMNAFDENEGQNCITLILDPLKQCMRSGQHLQATDALIAHARGESSQSFEDLYCRYMFEADKCFTEAMQSCNNSRIEAVNKKYSEYLKVMKVCNSHQTSGSVRVFISYSFAALLPLLSLTKCVP